MPTRHLPRPWKVRHNEETYWIEAANGAGFSYCYFRDAAKEPIGTGPEKLSSDLARRVTSQIAKLPDGVLVPLEADVREALARFIASRPEKLTEAQAVALLVRDALIGIGDLPLGAANRGKAAGRGK